MDNNNNKSINIELNEEVAQGVYSNLVVITHSSSEFVLDFVRVMPGLPKAQVKSRVILTPDHAKRLLLAMQDNLAKFEANMGTIKLGENPQEQPLPFPMNFGGKGEA